MDIYTTPANLLLSAFPREFVLSHCMGRRTRSTRTIINLMLAKRNRNIYRDDSEIVLGIEVNKNTMNIFRMGEIVCHDVEEDLFLIIDPDVAKEGKLIDYRSFEMGHVDVKNDIEHKKYYNDTYSDVIELIEEERGGISHLYKDLYTVFYICTIKEVREFRTEYNLIRKWKSINTSYKSIVTDDSRKSIQEIVKINTIHCGGILPFELIDLISLEIVKSNHK